MVYFELVQDANLTVFGKYNSSLLSLGGQTAIMVIQERDFHGPFNNSADFKSILTEVKHMRITYQMTQKVRDSATNQVGTYIWHINQHFDFQQRGMVIKRVLFNFYGVATTMTNAGFVFSWLINVTILVVNILSIVT